MTTFGYHTSIYSLLDSIAELDPMVGPTEMVCGWFDDLYFPAQQNVVGQQTLKEWSDCFSQTELDALEQFHYQFASVVDNLSGDPQSFKDDPQWIDISVLARKALTAFDGDS